MAVAGATGCSTDEESSAQEIPTTTQVRQLQPPVDPDRDPALDSVEVCEAANAVGGATELDQGSENMDGEAYVLFVDEMERSLAALVQAQPPAATLAAAETLLGLFEQARTDLEQAERGPDPAWPDDDAALSAMGDVFADEDQYFAAIDLASGNELNCS